MTDALHPHKPHSDLDPSGLDVAAADLELGHLSQPQVIGLSLASFIPAIGIATVPAFMVPYAGNSSWLAIVASVAVFIGIACLINVFARRFVGTGSLYSYIRSVFGRWSQVAMAAALVPGYIVAIMSVVVAVGLYSGSFLVSVGVESASGKVWQGALYAVAGLIATAICYRGIDVSVRISVILTVISVPAVLIVIGATLMRGDLDLAGQFTLSDFTVSGFMEAVAIGSAFFVAFESCASLAAETQEPRRVIPRAIMIVPALLGGAYIVATFIQVPSLLQSTNELATGASPMAVLADRAGLGVVSQVTDIVLASASFASLIGLFNYGPRVLVSAASDGMFPSALLDVHPRYKSPTKAIFFIAVPAVAGPIALLLVSTQSPLALYGIIATLLVYFWVVPYILICIAAAILLYRLGNRLALPTLVGAIGVSIVVLWLWLNGVVNPGAAPLNAMPYVMVVTVAIFAVALGLTLVRNSKKSDIADG